MDILQYFKNFSKRKMHYFIFALIGLFLILTAIVYFLPTTVIDYEFSEEVQEHRNPFLHFLMLAISWFGSNWVAVGLVGGTAILFVIFRYFREALFVLFTIAIWIITWGIKVLINRPRPSADIVEVMVKANHQSFPSGHTSFYVVFFGFLIFLMLVRHEIPKLIRYAVITFSLFLILSVPFSRIYLGAHWFTDVSAGLILGLIVLYILIRLYISKVRK